MTLYVDTSSLVKLYVTEAGSEVVRQLVSDATVVATSVVAYAETRAALGTLGHSVSAWPDWDWRAGAVCCVVVGPDGTLRGGADPRRGALAIGW